MTRNSFCKHSNMAAPNRTHPKDSQIMTAILKDMGVIEYEQRIVNQMLEFTYRYVTNILDDARLFSTHAKKKVVDVDDVRLAIQLQMDKSFTNPPPRDLLIEIARQKNSISMPLIKANIGPRLPPDRYSLTSSNYRMKSIKKSRVNHSAASRLSFNSMQGQSLKLNPAISLSNKTGATLSVVNKGLSGPTVTVAARSHGKSNTGKTAPTPIIKMSTGAPTIRTSISSGPMPSIQIQTNKTMDAINGIPDIAGSNKRKRDDFADDYDVE